MGRFGNVAGWAFFQDGLGELEIYAGAWAKLQKPAGKGSRLTLGQTLQKVADKTGRVPDALKLPEVRDEMMYLWGWYHKVKRTAEPLTWQEIKAWSEMSSTPINARDAEAIMRVDDAILRASRDDDEAGKTGSRGG